MWVSATKRDLMIEVWERLDCESVGREEVEAITAAVRERFGDAAVDSPMVVARVLADEGAELRHSEIMDLWIEFAEDRPYEPAFRNLLNVNGLSSAARSLRQMENLRRKYAAEGDKEGVRLLLAEVREAKEALLSRAAGDPDGQHEEFREIAEWLTIWLQSPEVFEPWLKLRRSSADYIRRFGDIDQ